MIKDIDNHQQKIFSRNNLSDKSDFSDKSNLTQKLNSHKNQIFTKIDFSLLSFPSRQATQNMGLTLCPHDPKNAFVGNLCGHASLKSCINIFSSHRKSVNSVF